MKLKSNEIRVTPILGGMSDGGVAVLLELGVFRILLDCGCSSSAGVDNAINVTKSYESLDRIDAILLSHADLNHIGGLPYLSKKKILSNVPLFCTLPVYKFGQIVLYDHFLNSKMEHTEVDDKIELDDIDDAFKNVTTVKFSQTISVPKQHLIDVSSDTNIISNISVCAFPSGRTIGGTMWRIRCGSTEILYTVDLNLRKEIVLDGAPLEYLPSSPALMIVGGNYLDSTNSGTLSKKKKRSEKDEANLLLSIAMETLRNGSNILIPCETGGRVLELLQLFSKYWMEQKLGLYQLIFLSHMAENVPEFAKMQLEWMSDSLSRSFYNGKPNPFELPPVKLVTNIKQIERLYPGPKVVLATDASLSCGWGKELLLKWGGDPRCRVLFVDPVSDPFSLAAELRKKVKEAPPLIVSLNRTKQVDLSGVELIEFQSQREQQRILREEILQRKRRHEELTQLNDVGGIDIVEEDDENDPTINFAASKDKNAQTPKFKHDMEENVRKKQKTNALQRLLDPNFKIFETKEIILPIDDYGVSISDLNFQDIQASDTRWGNKENALTLAENPVKTDEIERVTDNSGFLNQEEMNLLNSTLDLESVPKKLVAIRERMQFTCEFKEVNISGRPDFKAIKTIIQRVSPLRLFVVHGTEKKCKDLVNYAKLNNIEVFAPKNLESISFSVRSEKLKVSISQSLLPSTLQTISSIGTTGGNSSTLQFGSAGSNVIKCLVSSLTGRVLSIDGGINSTSQQEGTKLVKFVGLEEGEKEVVDKKVVEVGEDDVREVEEGVKTVAELQDSLSFDSSLGVVSVGEVTFQSLKKLVEQATGTIVEFRLGTEGGMLICGGGQVIIRKHNSTDFIIEGPPIPAFYEARRAVYDRFAFV